MSTDLNEENQIEENQSLDQMNLKRAYQSPAVAEGDWISHIVISSD